MVQLCKALFIRQVQAINQAQIPKPGLLTASSALGLSLPYMTQQNHGNALAVSLTAQKSFTILP